MAMIDDAHNVLTNVPINLHPRKKGTIIYMNSKIDAIFEKNM